MLKVLIQAARDAIFIKVRNQPYILILAPQNIKVLRYSMSVEVAPEPRETSKFEQGVGRNTSRPRHQNSMLKINPACTTTVRDIRRSWE